MSKKWQQTDTAVDGTPLMLEDGKYYTQHAWDHFGDAYRGEVKAKLRGADADSNWWHTPETAAWLAGDEDTEELEPFTFDLSDDVVFDYAGCRFVLAKKFVDRMGQPSWPSQFEYQISSGIAGASGTARRKLTFEQYEKAYAALRDVMAKTKP